MLIYDIEIEKAIPPKDPADRLDGIQYCDGWSDHANMGIACIGVYDSLAHRYRVYCQDNLADFVGLSSYHRELKSPLVGFNNIAFDNAVLAANGIDIPDECCLDLLQKIWLSAGLAPTYQGGSHNGFGLDACCKANFGLKKSGKGALAPAQWQRGQIGAVIDYCLNDIYLTKRLFHRIVGEHSIKDPRNPDNTLRFEPDEWPFLV